MLKAVQCRECGLTYSDQGSLSAHHDAVHKTEKVCRKSALPSDQLREDLKNHYGIAESEFDPYFDYHYENGSKEMKRRGGETFFPPSYCTKIALNVDTKYRDDSWLDPQHGWPVAYHGTSADHAGSIIRNGLLVSGGRSSPTHGAVYGPGVYVSPKHEVQRTIHS